MFDKPPSGSSYFDYNGLKGKGVSFPLGGIGTGSIGLSGAGRLIDWEIFNRPSKGSTNGLSHFAIRAERDGEVLDCRIINGPYLGDANGDFRGETYRNHGFGANRNALAGLPHFRDCSFHGRFPIAELGFADPSFPGEVSFVAFNPFVPTNERDSSMPVAMFEFEIRNTASTALDYTLVGVLAHAMAEPRAVRLPDGPGWSGVAVSSADVPRDEPGYAELLIATDADDTSHQHHLNRGLWYDSLEVYWKELRGGGRFADRNYTASPIAGGVIRDEDCSLKAAHLRVPAGGRQRVRMLIGWYVPMFEKYWISPSWHFRQAPPGPLTWRNWYATEWPGVEAVAAEVFARWDELAGVTARFRDAVYGSSLPIPMLDAAAANLSTLKSPTVLRLEDGLLYGWEGLHADAGACEGSCTHVWNYQQAVPFLFPALSRGMKEADYAYNLDEAGGLSFRLGLPRGTHLRTEHPCVDGQFGNVMTVYRDWRLCGDDAWLAALWPRIRRTIEYAWSPDNPDRWDPGQTGVLWGRQHHTLDMELFGPNGWLTGFYIGALQAGAEMARALGDAEAAGLFAGIAEKGRAWARDNLFNGAYFVQKIALDDRAVLDDHTGANRSLRVPGASVEEVYWSGDHGELRYQLGEGCILDQLVSQWHATLYGLPPIFEPAQIDASLKAVFRYNFHERLDRVSNYGRVLGWGDEAGTVTAAWPDARTEPRVALPYATETLHGMEYAYAVTLAQHGMLEEAERVARAVRDRYDGERRNPWSEMEAGSNYSRSMSAWSAVLAFSGYEFDARRDHLGFRPRWDGERFRCFWSANTAWGVVEIGRQAVEVAVDYGTLPLASIGLPLARHAVPVLAVNGVPHPARREERSVAFAALHLRAGDRLRITAAEGDLIDTGEDA